MNEEKRGKPAKSGSLGWMKLKCRVCGEAEAELADAMAKVYVRLTLTVVTLTLWRHYRSMVMVLLRSTVMQAALQSHSLPSWKETGAILV